MRAFSVARLTVFDNHPLQVSAPTFCVFVNAMISLVRVWRLLLISVVVDVHRKKARMSDFPIIVAFNDKIVVSRGCARAKKTVARNGRFSSQLDLARRDQSSA
jgi:hypothetical protein